MKEFKRFKLKLNNTFTLLQQTHSWWYQLQYEIRASALVTIVNFFKNFIMLPVSILFGDVYLKWIL